jgi:hypothetical protein
VGHAGGLGKLTAGASVHVQGSKRTDGSIDATRVEVVPAHG